MDDLISRQSVNDAMDRTCDLVCEYSKEQRYIMCWECPLGCAFDAVADLPSAQPEIIMCKECKNHNFCAIEDEARDETFFCKWGERRN